jgi:UDP-3-O-[3-hydroxymyristoyl] N-acetylglucosamine deacetylase
MKPLRTIGRPVGIDGSGVHSGKPVHLDLLPSGSGQVVFRRTDLGGAEMGLDPANVESRNSTTLVGERFRVRTVEHFLAALSGLGLGSLTVALDAEEMPILDGSALPFVRAIEQAGIVDAGKSAPALRIVRTLTLIDGDAWVRLEPDPSAQGLTLEYTIVYDHPLIGSQTLALPLTPEVFSAEIAPARTFGFLQDVEGLHRRGLALGASTANTVVLDERGLVNPPLRFPDEFVRHKLLDLAGDLALLGRPLAGRAAAFKAGHRLHLETVRRLLAHPESAVEE